MPVMEGFKAGAGILRCSVCKGEWPPIQKLKKVRWCSREAGGKESFSEFTQGFRVLHSRLCCHWCSCELCDQKLRSVSMTLNVCLSFGWEKCSSKWDRVCERRVAKLHMAYGRTVLLCRIHLLQQSWLWNIFLRSHLVDFYTDFYFCQFQVKLRDLFSIFFYECCNWKFFN